MRKISLGTILFVWFLALVIWIDIPQNIPIKLDYRSIHIDTQIGPPSIDITVFGKKIYKSFETKLGLDLRGGSHLVFQADLSKTADSDKNDALISARDTIERRVNFFGVSEPNVQTVRAGDDYRISVDLPGVENIDEAISLIGTTAQLEFKEEATDEAVLKQIDQMASDSPQLAFYLKLSNPTGLNGAHVKKATVQFGQSGNNGANLGSASVGLEFDKEGADLFEQITERNLNKPLGIFIDDQLLSAPTVNQVISGGDAVITGQFTPDEAKSLANAINSGALPVPIQLIEQRNIGPTLGQESIEKSIVAGVIGLASVVLFMILYYGRLGLIAATGLLIYGLISFAIIRAIPVVLTLPGIAGFILSIGMAVDANILIFERIKEEQRKGRTFKMAMDLGFGRAIDAIKDANIATLLVAFILFNPLNWDFFPQFGLIRGFALTLSIGVITSLFTGIFITRRLMEMFYTKK